MATLIDTQALAWFGIGDTRLISAGRTAIESGDALFLSAVTAYEFADLNRRGRFGANLPLASLLSQLEAVVLDSPSLCWPMAVSLPGIHRDPIDRMLVAHAIHLDATLITSDAHIHRYPVRWLW